MATRVLLADDHKVLREGLALLLTTHRQDIELVNEAASGPEVIELAARLRPDVVVMDIHMPGMSGMDATRQIVRDRPTTKVVALSASGTPDAVEGMIRAGACGFVAKDSAFEDLINAIDAALDGGLFLSPGLAARFEEGFLQRAADPRREKAAGGGQVMSPREREVLQLIAEGKATKEVAACLHLSVKTVETHRRNLMEKLNLDSVAQLTRYAVREGLVAL